MTPPILSFTLIPGLHPKRALSFLVAAVLTVMFALRAHAGRAWTWARIRPGLDAELDAWLRDVFADEERRQS